MVHETFFYVLDLATVNSLLLYRRTLNKKANNICHFVILNMILLHGFCLATNILQKGEDPVNKITLPKKRRKSFHSAESVRRDGSGNLPSCVKTKQRCKQCVHKFTRVICTKCNVGFCLLNDRNCYITYHEK